MKKREIKFRAWIPKLGIMLEDVPFYDRGPLVYDYDEFHDELDNHNLILDDKDLRVYREEDGKKIELLEVMTVEDVIYIEDAEYELIEFTGRKDEKGNDSYEGDVILYEHSYAGSGRRIIVYNPEKLGFWMADDINTLEPVVCGWGMMKRFHVLGNIFQNPELMEGK